MLPNPKTWSVYELRCDIFVHLSHCFHILGFNHLTQYTWDHHCLSLTSPMDISGEFIYRCNNLMLVTDNVFWLLLALNVPRVSETAFLIQVITLTFVLTFYAWKMYMYGLVHAVENVFLSAKKIYQWKILPINIIFLFR